MEIQEQLLLDGIANGMCARFRENWGSPDIKELCEKYFAGQDFCIKNDWPKLDWLRENVKGKTEIHGIYIDSNDSIISNRDMRDMAFLGDSVIDIDVFDMCDITVRHNSSISITAHASSFVYVSLYDDAKLIILKKEKGARICVSHFGGEIVNEQLIDRYHKKF